MSGQSCQTIQIFLLESLSFEKAKLWRKCLSLAQKKRACSQIRPRGNILHQDRRYHCLHRQEYEYAETRGAALRSHKRPKRAEIPHLGRSIAQRSFHQFWCALWCKGAELSCHPRGNWTERGWVHSAVQTLFEYADSKRGRLAQIRCVRRGCKRSLERPAIKSNRRERKSPACFLILSATSAAYRVFPLLEIRG